MKTAHLLHNPKAGDKDFTKSELMKLIKNEGFDCTYASLKKSNWDQFDDNIDFIVVAGGDGTVRSTAKALLNRTLLDKQFPIALLPHGTANNIAETLQVSGGVSKIIQSWKKSVLKKFDVGKVEGLSEAMFFLEAFGFGIFPKLMKVMEKMKDDPAEDRKDKIKIARALLYDVVLSYKAQKCKIIADGVDHTGKYIMVEVMNIRSIGPNLELSKDSDPGDGEFEIVLIPEDHQKKFEEFLLNRINGQEDSYSFTTLKAKEIQILWEGKDVHTDDETVRYTKPAEINITVQPGLMEFLVAGE
jgi:diacylglycerol kinase (ATP)